MKSPTDTSWTGTSSTDKGRPKGRGSAARRLWSETGGNVSVELAVVVLILVPMTIAAFDFGMGFREQLRLRSAARAGAQYAMTWPNLQDVPGTIQAARADARDMTNSLNIVPTYSCTCPSGAPVACADTTGFCGGEVPYNFITVTVGSIYDTVFDYPGLPSSISLQEMAVLRIR